MASFWVAHVTVGPNSPLDTGRLPVWFMVAGTSAVDPSVRIPVKLRRLLLHRHRNDRLPPTLRRATNTVTPGTSADGFTGVHFVHSRGVQSVVVVVDRTRPVVGTQAVVQDPGLRTRSPVHPVPSRAEDIGADRPVWTRLVTVPPNGFREPAHRLRMCLTSGQGRHKHNNGYLSPHGA